MDLWDCALSFMHSQMLLTAEDVGVFDCLDEAPRTAEDVAEATGLPPDSARRLLTGLCALDIVERRPDGRYVNGPEAETQLVSGKPDYIGDMFDHVREVLYPSWGNLEEVLRANGTATDGAAEDGVPSENVYDDPDSLRSFMEGMHTITYGSAKNFAAHAPELEEVDHIVDIGGASGAFLIALAEQFPHLEGVIYDLGPVRPIAEDFIRDSGLEDRISFQEGDFFNYPIPSGRDAYSLGYILHDWDEDAGSLLLSKIADAIRPGGLLIIGESLLNEERTGPLHVARNNLNMMVVARGRERTADEYRDWIGEHGFKLERIQPTDEKDFLIARRT